MVATLETFLLFACLFAVKDNVAKSLTCCKKRSAATRKRSLKIHLKVYLKTYVFRINQHNPQE